jgi:hypothetical protein
VRSREAAPEWGRVREYSDMADVSPQEHLLDKKSQRAATLVQALRLGPLSQLLVPQNLELPLNESCARCMFA